MSQHVILFKCPNCGRNGTAVWEITARRNALVNLSDGFYERTTKKARALRTELVCGDCGTVQPNTINPTQLHLNN